MLTGYKTLKNHPAIVELKKLTLGVKLVRKNTSKSTTNIRAFGSGKRLLKVTIHIIFMHYLIVLPLLLLNTN